MYIGQDKQLKLTVLPNAEVPFSYVSDNPRIVAALSSGKLQAVKMGETSVTVSYLGHSETCRIRVVTKKEYAGMGLKDDDSQSENKKSGCRSTVDYGSLTILYLSLIGLFALKKKHG